MLLRKWGLGGPRGTLMQHAEPGVLGRLHGSCLMCAASLPALLPASAPKQSSCRHSHAFHHAYETLLLGAETRHRGALVVPLLAACGLSQICMCARGKKDLRWLLPSPNVLFLTPLHAFPEISVRFEEPLCLQRTDRNRSKKQLSERKIGERWVNLCQSYTAGLSRTQTNWSAFLNILDFYLPCSLAR